jgi:hypothetical protein
MEYFALSGLINGTFALVIGSGLPNIFSAYEILKNTCSVIKPDAKKHIVTETATNSHYVQFSQTCRGMPSIILSVTAVLNMPSTLTPIVAEIFSCCLYITPFSKQGIRNSSV